ncbi:oligosaccharide flippase family protein [bacterium]|nr:oligosaccharide flippase family protein [candidate division CSSED10-310 bacterium]
MHTMSVDSKSQLKRAIQGFFSLTVSKVVFLLAGYVVYFSLPRLFGSADLFGDYIVIINLLNIFNMVLITGTIQAVSKFVSEDETRDRAVRKAAYKIQAVIGGCAFLLLFIGAPFYANTFNDPSLTPYIRLSAFIPVCYAFYAVMIGSLNGRRAYTRQAALDISFAMIKTTGILVLAGLGFGVLGALSGFIAAAFIIVFIATILVVKTAPSCAMDIKFPVKQILVFELYVMIFTFLNNLLLATDILMVKSILNEKYHLISIGLTNLVNSFLFPGHPVPSNLELVQKIPSILSGYYGAVLTFSRIPYTFVTAISLVAFPMVSKVSFEKNLSKMQDYIRQTLRLTGLIVVPIALVFVAFPSEFLGFVYPSDYIMGKEALCILPIGEIMLSMMFVSIAMITGSGFPKISVMITAITLCCDVILCYLLIPRYALAGAALASTVAWTAGFIMTNVWLKVRFKSNIPAMTAVRLVVAGGVALLTAVYAPGSGLLKIFVGFFILIAVYGTILIILKEIGIAELTIYTRQLFKRR